jgi:hypothetical protein
MKISVIRGRIIRRGDNGPDPSLPSKEELFINLEGRIYPISWINSAPPILQSQIAVDRECFIETEDLGDPQPRGT